MASQVPPESRCRTTLSPGSPNRAAATSRSVVTPGTSQSCTRGIAVTLTWALPAPPEAASRKTALRVMRRAPNRTRPRGPVTPLPACRQPGEPATCSSSRTRTPASGWPRWVSFPEMTSVSAAGSRTRPTVRTRAEPAFAADALGVGCGDEGDGDAV